MLLICILEYVRIKELEKASADAVIENGELII